VYQDRPAHAFLAWASGSILRLIGFPNQTREILGNSGTGTQYESVFYISFLLINYLTLVIAVLLAIKFVTDDQFQKKSVSSFSTQLIVILIVAANELTKTFFWTPHSQMFNILLPVLALVMISRRSKIDTFKAFFATGISVFCLMFFYPIFGILFSVLFFATYSTLLRRCALISIFTLGYLSYPRIISFFGGNFSNYAIDQYRQYIWIYDSLAKGDFLERLHVNLGVFFSTFPLFPSIFVVATVAFLVYMSAISSGSKVELKRTVLPYLLFLLLYVLTLSLMGYYSRRLTLGVLIFLELSLLKGALIFLNNQFQKTQNIVKYLLITVLIGSWVWTNGPLS
jgi:hypothetical protein